MTDPKVRPESSDNDRLGRLQALKSENSVSARIRERLGGRSAKWLASASGIPESTVGDYMAHGIRKPSGAVAIARALDCSVDWLLTGREFGGRQTIMASEQVDVVDVPVLPIAASAGPGIILDEDGGEQDTVPLPVRWLRRFGTPSRLRLVEIVGGSMTPPLEDGDWVLINLDRTDLREGIAVVRYDESLFIKRVQPEGRRVRLTSSAEGYEPRVIDLAAEPNAFKVIGYAEGRWRARGLA